jgi:hypothetical protein
VRPNVAESGWGRPITWTLYRLIRVLEVRQWRAFLKHAALGVESDADRVSRLELVLRRVQTSSVPAAESALVYEWHRLERFWSRRNPTGDGSRPAAIAKNPHCAARRSHDDRHVEVRGATAMRDSMTVKDDVCA